MTFLEAVMSGPEAFETFMEEARKSLSPRKRRLLAAALCRTLWHLPAEDASRRAVRAARGFCRRADRRQGTTSRSPRGHRRLRRPSAGTLHPGRSVRGFG